MQIRSLLACAALAACAEHGSAGASADAAADQGADSGATPDAAVDASSPDAAVGSGMPATLVIGASAGTVTDAFRLSASGTAGTPYGAVSLSADVGTIDLGGGAAPAFVYATVAEGGYTLYDGFAVTPTSWDAFYLYCNNGALADVYDERVGGHGMVYAPVTGGACSASTTQTAAQVALPAFSISTPAPVGGSTVSGNAIEIADGTGTVVVGATRMPLVVFDTVDCSACGGAGWFELHSIVWDAGQQRAIFVIVYLINGTPGSVELAYARSLPDLGDPLGTRTLAATWTATSSRSQARTPRGVPPPALSPPSAQADRSR
jgi:hypothetical protein